MQKQLKKNYPLYETTVFPDFKYMINQSADKFPDKVALSYKENPNDKEVKKLTYTEVRRDVEGMGESLADRGMTGRYAMICGRLCVGWVYSYFSLMCIGSVTVPVDKDMSLDDLVDIARRTGTTAVFFSSDARDKIEQMKQQLPAVELWVAMDGEGAEDEQTVTSLVAEGLSLREGGACGFDSYVIDPDAAASVVFTSGTTGKGKGVVLSQTNIVSDMTQGMYNFAITPKTMFLLPPHHTFGSTVNLVGHYAQGSEIYLSSGIKYFLREVGEQQPSHLILVPLFLETLYKKVWATAEKKGKAGLMRTMMKVSRGLRKVGIDLRAVFFKEIRDMLGGKLEMVICGGAPLTDNVIEMFDAIGITVLNGYGITECAPLISCNRNRFQKKGSVGTPIIGEQVKILDPDENGEGEICVKGPNVMLGYFGDPEATAEVFDSEGYFRTGDYGYLDDEGWIYITGRKKNMILFSNGKNVYPEEIETKLSNIYGIGEVIVYAGKKADGTECEVIVAEIFPDKEALELRGIADWQQYFDAQVKAACGTFEPFKRVGKVKLRDTEFEKNTSKKILRFKIDRTID